MSYRCGQHSYLLTIILLFHFELAHATIRLCSYIGYGGSGISTVETFNDTVGVSVSRSEQPGMLGISVEYPTSDRRSFSFDHQRGFVLSPFTSGVGFTGATWRWYYKYNLPMINENEGKSKLFISNRVPFIGLSTGIAGGTIHRANDAVPNVTANALYLGFRAGVDQQLEFEKIFRIEMFYARTPDSTGLVESSLSAFALQFGYVFNY